MKFLYLILLPKLTNLAAREVENVPFICAPSILGPYYKARRGGCIWEANSRLCHADQAKCEETNGR